MKVANHGLLFARDHELQIGLDWRLKQDEMSLSLQKLVAECDSP